MLPTMRWRGESSGDGDNVGGWGWIISPLSATRSSAPAPYYLLNVYPHRWWVGTDAFDRNEKAAKNILSYC